ncbi:MAG: spondin domain-containing protein, partial [Pseudomonadota bacterium]
MKKSMMASVFTLLSWAGASHAADFTVQVTNLTSGNHFTPLLVAAHPSGSSLFTTGQPASASLQAMAEGGDISGLESDLTGLSATMASNPANGLLAPGGSASADLNTDGTSNTQLTVVAMLLPTNDAFLGLNAITIPEEPGTYSWNVNAYDSGTEANDEIINGGGMPGAAGIPAAPAGDGGTGAMGVMTGAENGTVHIHRGVLGDTD